ncbi:MAG TPA: acetamidase/formamidase family protein [Gryllotalpicola sp.]
MDVLQPLADTPREGYLPATPRTVLWGRLPSRCDEPVLRVAPGESVVIDTVSHEGLMPDQGSDPRSYFGRFGVAAADVLEDAVEITASVHRDPAADGPHVVTGPIAVTGARPGDLLAVTIEALAPRVPYGVVSTRHGKGVLAGDGAFEGDYGAFCAVEPGGAQASIELGGPDASRAVFPLNPFLGIIGVAPDSDERPHSVPPGLHGGNIDIRDLTVGATLFLPVQCDDALLSVGDPHFAQGDGEVALTALEASLRATLRVDVISRAELGGALEGVEGPFGRAGGLLLPTGLDGDLDVALQKAVRNGIRLLANLTGADPQRLYLYLSAAADFDISQAVDLVKGVHGRIRLADLPGPFPGWLLPE